MVKNEHSEPLFKAGERSNTLLSRLNEIAWDQQLYNEQNFEQRAAAIDFIEFEIIAELEYEQLQNTVQEQAISLKKCAEHVKLKLEAVDDVLFEKLRDNIRAGLWRGAAFLNLVKDYLIFNLADSKHHEEAGYDNLDFFLNALLYSENMPEQRLELAPEMVYYQKTPARIVFELTERANFSGDDVFVDLGSGLGQVAIIVNLLTAIKTVGIEFEPAFTAYAAKCAAALNLTDVSFINNDARDTDYSEGTVFFMFTPFKGEIMNDVLAALYKESQKRKIKIITYGPCTAEVALQTWLHNHESGDSHDYKLTFFSSCIPKTDNTQF